MASRTKQGDSKRAVGYLRVSTDEQQLGPSAQRQAIERWASANGVAIVAWHSDLGVSGGAALEKRPALLAAIDDLGANGAGVLIVAKRDRLARDVVLAAMIEQLAKRQGARIVSAAGEGGDDESDPASMLMRRMIDAFAEYERQIIKARTRAALGVKRGRGERIGEVPYGFRLAADDTHVEPDAAEQAVIAKVMEMRAAGLSIRSIVAECARAGIVSRAGRPLNSTQIHRLVARAAA